MDTSATSSSTIHQLMKFIFVGILNTAIDLGVLNALIFIFATGSNSTFYVLFKAISFTVALINSYFWNKFWVFKTTGGKKKESALFVIMSSIGFILNVLIASLVFVMLGKLSLVPDGISANIGALVGTLAVLSWNFASYKFFVFKN